MDHLGALGPSHDHPSARSTRHVRAGPVAAIALRLGAATLGVIAVVTMLSPQAAGSDRGRLVERSASADADEMACEGGSPAGRMAGPTVGDSGAVEGWPDSAVTGVDVSHWDGLVRFDRARDAGHRFAIIKATQGARSVDPRFRSHLEAARAAGLVVGAYHFFDQRVDGRAQADHLLEQLAVAGIGPGDLPPAIDVECLPTIDAVPVADAVSRLRAMVRRVYQRTGRYPMVYTSRWMWRRGTADDRGFGHLPLWVACWRCTAPALPAGWSRSRIWQVGPVALEGRERRLDGNVIVEGEAGLALLRAGDPTVMEGSRTSARQVTIAAGTLDGAMVRGRAEAAPWTAWAPADEVLRIPLPEEDGPVRIAIQGRDPWGTRSPVSERTVVADRTPPMVAVRVAGVVLDAPVSALGGIPVAWTVAAVDATTGVDATEGVAACGPGRPRSRGVARGRGGAAVARDEGRGYRVAVPPGGGCVLSGRAIDGVGLSSTALPVRLRLRWARRLTMPTPSVGWSRQVRRGAVRGSVWVATGEGAVMDILVRGRHLAIVAPRGPGRGQVRVSVDGGPEAVVELASPGRVARSVVWSARVEGSGPHRLRIVAGPASGRVVIDEVVGVAVRSGAASDR